MHRLVPSLSLTTALSTKRVTVWGMLSIRRLRAGLAIVKVDGEYLISGKNVTGFSNSEEEAVGLTSVRHSLTRRRTLRADLLPGHWRMRSAPTAVHCANCDLYMTIHLNL